MSDLINKVHLVDCMEFMKSIPDKYYELAIPDPEYGLGEDGGKCRSKYVVQKNGKKLYVRGDYKRKEWDKKPAPPEYFEELFRISQHQIIWGCNNYHANFGAGRIIWDKVNEGSDQSDCEIAYNSNGKRVDLFRYMWRGMLQGKSITEGHIMQGNKRKNERRIHPTQKPVLLYKWILQKYAKPGDKIFDSHVGSGSLRIACYDLGFYFEGCEVDEDYWNDQEIRFCEYKQQSELFGKEEIQNLIYEVNS